MARADQIFERAIQNYPGVIERLNQQVTGAAYFNVFQQLSDNYSPTLTVSRVQGPLVQRLVAEGSGKHTNLTVDTNTRRSGSISIKVGQGTAPIWLSAHADVCSYLTGAWDGSGYPLTPFCTHRSSPGARAAMALDLPDGNGPLGRLTEGQMITDENNTIRFVCPRDDLPLSTRVVHHQAAYWEPNADVVSGFLDNQAGSAALILAASVLSHYDVQALMLLNDEEEGPVDRGNQGFSRASNRLLHRTPIEQLPNYAVVIDGHGQEDFIRTGAPTTFGQGASYAGFSSTTRGAVTPPQLLGFTRDLAGWAATHGIAFHEHPGYVGRSDDISLMQFTPNVSIIGYPNAYSHFEKAPKAIMADLVNLTKILVLVTLMAQDAAWQERYL